MLNNQRTKDVLLQALLVSAIAVTLIYCALRIKYAVQAQGMVSGFGFLDRTTGWDISFSVLKYSVSDTYAWVIFVGFINTIYTGILGIMGATVLGAMIGLARLSSNFLLRMISTVYVNFFRNIPLILQVIFWYQIINHLPHSRQALNVGGLFFLSNRGLYWPTLNLAPWTIWGVAVLILVTVVILATRKRIPVVAVVSSRKILLLALTVVLGVLVIGILGRSPVFDVPRVGGLNIRGGSVLQPELWALVLAVWLYGGAYIGEVVRSGFMSVRKGQTEAAQSLGLKPLQIFLRVRFPLAIRAMLPTLSNQYILLMKSTTLGIAIGFSELFFVISTSINQSGQTLELLSILMLGFLMINVSIGLSMNWLNKKLALKGK